MHSFYLCDLKNALTDLKISSLHLCPYHTMVLNIDSLGYFVSKKSGRQTNIQVLNIDCLGYFVSEKSGRQTNMQTNKQTNRHIEAANRSIVAPNEVRESGQTQFISVFNYLWIPSLPLQFNSDGFRISFNISGYFS